MECRREELPDYVPFVITIHAFGPTSCLLLSAAVFVGIACEWFI
jgi:hypothetical protein